MRKLGKYALLLEPRDYRAMPWKNGRGVTREIAVFPPHSALVDQSFLWRISLADVTCDCEFSSFPGYDRTLLLAEGNGMALSFDTAPAVEIRERWWPVHFQGEWHTRCRLLDGPVRDFNVMTAREKVSHTCEIVRREAGVLWRAGLETVLFYCSRGEFTLSSVELGPSAMASGQTILLEKDVTLSLETVINLRPATDAAIATTMKIQDRPQAVRGNSK
ncbi:MAG: HutD/Ves family protein [Gammaproteobacteria bacterium]